MKKTTYEVATYDGRTSYMVTIDDDGVIKVDGLTPSGAEVLEFGVLRHIGRGLPAVQALQKAVGAYSYLTEIKDV